MSGRVGSAKTSMRTTYDACAGSVAPHRSQVTLPLPLCVPIDSAMRVDSTSGSQPRAWRPRLLFWLTMPTKTFYITTPIYYPNGEPHVGHIYTTLATDTIARYHRLAGDDVFMLTGTDEHGVKMVKTAADQAVEPQALADQNVAVFRQVWKELGITHDDFIRTTEPRHKLAVQEIVRKLVASDDIYLGHYEGWYDEGQEEFVTE